MTLPFTHRIELGIFDPDLEDTDPRARRFIRPEPDIGIAAGGWLIGSWRGDIGDYFDIKYAGSKADDSATFVLYPSGGIEAVSLVDDTRWVCDKDHPWGGKLNPDGTVDDKPFLARPVGRVRIYMRANGTHRVCFAPVDAFGARTFEQIKAQHVIGPTSVVIPKDGIFALEFGRIVVAGVEISEAPHVVYAETGPQVLDIPAGTYGTVACKARLL